MMELRAKFKRRTDEEMSENMRMIRRHADEDTDDEDSDEDDDRDDKEEDDDETTKMMVNLKKI